MLLTVLHHLPFQTEVEKIKAHIVRMFNIFSKSIAVYEIMWKKILVESDMPHDNIIRRMRFASWITEAVHTHTHTHTHTNSEYVIHNALPLPQLLHEQLQCYVIRTLPVLHKLNSIVLHILT